MSRSGYSDDCENNWGLICWRGAVNSAIRGKRGQAMLRELLEALDAMPDKRLIAEKLEADGQFCTLGVLGDARGILMDDIDPDDYDKVASAFGCAPALVREIVFENDEHIDKFDWINVEICGPMRPHYHERHSREVRVPAKNIGERRWNYMRNWVANQLRSQEKPA